MPTILPQMGLTLPTRGPTGSGHWADVLDADLALLDAHNHQPGGTGGARINTAAIAIDADLSFSSLWAVKDLKRATFASVAPPGVNKSIFVGDGTGGTTANELYWTSAGGSNVKVTDAGNLNVAAFVGGIVGDYQSVGAQLAYDDSAKRYTFKEGTSDSNKWARVYCGGLRLAEFNTTDTIFVEQLAPAALAVTYAMTWPLAVPAGAQQMVQIDNTGQFIFGNTSVDAVTMASNANITLAGTGDIKHGNRTLDIPAVAGFANSGTFTRGTGGDITCTVAGVYQIPVPLRAGDRVQSVTIGGFGDGAVDVTLDVLYQTKASVNSTKATATITNAPAGWNDSTATAGAPAALATGESCVINITPNAGAFAFTGIRVVYDRP